MIAVIADSHLGQAPGGTEAFLAAVERIRAGGVGSLYLLGDIFQYLVGDRRLAGPSLDPFLGAIRKLRAGGTSVVYVEGNRDFFLRGSYLEDEFDALGTEASFSAGSRKFLLVHGDGINERDWPYRFWRLVSKNPAARLALRAVPGAMASRFVARMERRLRETNFKHKSSLPVDMIRSFAARRLGEGYDVLLLGHFHEPWSARVGAGTVEILPAFLEERRWMEIDEAGVTSLASLT
jgi:UDP-2,3-diacylglucosamine hydrolase